MSLSDTDAKVRRWAFNSLAQLGIEQDVEIMIGPWQASRHLPEVFDAGLAALGRIVPRARLTKLLDQAGVGLGPSTLLALGQHTDEYADELACLRLDITKSNNADLRSATLLIGLRRAPDTLFSGRYPVSDVIGDLNTHPDELVAQYSFWATVEHPELGMSNVRVSPRDFPTLPPNVQGWAYRVFTKSGNAAFRHYDAIVSASESRHVVVREGLARGLRDLFYDSLDTTICDWLIDERDPMVRDLLLEHMAVHVAKSPGYRDEVVAAFRQSAPNSILRTRLEAANRDDGFALELRRIALQTGDPELFANIAGPTMKNSQIFNGPMQVGGLSNSGVGNSGDARFSSSAAAQQEAVRLLSEILKKLGDSKTPELESGKAVVQAAIELPTQNRVQRVLAFLKTVNEGGQLATALGSLGSQVYEQIGSVISNLPL